MTRNPRISVAENDTLSLASSQIGRYELNNTISGEYEITKKDLRGIIHKIGGDKGLSEIKETVVTNIRNVIENGDYLGWDSPDNGKHEEVAYFAYFGKEIGRKVYIGLRFMRSERLFKPYAVYSEDGFKERRQRIREGVPTI